MEWAEFTQGQPFITNIGQSPLVEVAGKTVQMGRYAVWSPNRENDRSHSVVEVGDDLDVLCGKYGIPGEMVFDLITDAPDE